MQHLNSVLLEGVLVDDPKLVIDNGTTRMAKLTIASNHYYLDKDGQRSIETCYMPIQLWVSIADKALSKVSKGSLVRVVGRLRQTRWIANDGTAHTAIEIVGVHVESKSKKSKGTEIALDSDDINV